ncbi:hypothetical protein [Hyphomonas sp.]|uniref:hypothetical protein n=1 Tax=Hyphomonas sp. TaxID=87 RepID=UPI0025C350DB|nr:hypothetical protein [Hyphomonas sp.]
MLGLALPTAVMAQTAPNGCTAPVMAEGVLAPWNSPAALSGTQLTIGQAARLTLLPTPEVRYAVPPERPADDASFGGVFTLTVSAPGTYRVALGSRGWIDVVSAGSTITSTAHGHGPECTGIRKMVDFPLAPGTYTIQIAGSPEPDAAVLVARLP